MSDFVENQSNEYLPTENGNPLSDEKYLEVLLRKQETITKPYQQEIERLAPCTEEQRKAVPLPRSYIGERILFLLDKNGMDIATFCRYMEISRSSMHRYIKGTHLPTKKNLRKIIDGLCVTPKQFASNLDDFEEWKKQIDDNSENFDVFELCQSFLQSLDTFNLTYTTCDNITKRLPLKHRETFRAVFEEAVALLRLATND